MYQNKPSLASIITFGKNIIQFIEYISFRETDELELAGDGDKKFDEFSFTECAKGISAD
jgi:hypothetical protein